MKRKHKKPKQVKDFPTTVIVILILALSWLLVLLIPIGVDFPLYVVISAILLMGILFNIFTDDFLNPSKKRKRKGKNAS